MPVVGERTTDHVHEMVEAAEIRGQKERDVLGAASGGYKSAQEVKGLADAKATTIYARAYGRDPDLYQFLKSMETLSLGLDPEGHRA